MIELRNVSLTREHKLILDDISFRVDAMERVAILGGSGAGKTTLLKLIMGLQLPDQGKILIDGEPIAAMNDRQLTAMRMKFAIVFQEGALFDSLNVKENVAFYLREHRQLDERQIEAAVRQMLELVGLRDILDRMPEELSGGMQRRVAIARALIGHQARMFLYDEPTSDLDPVNAENFCRLILKLAAQDKGFLMVTHEILYALAVAQRFMFIKDGRLAYDGEREGLLDKRNSDVATFIGQLYWEAVHQPHATYSLEKSS